MVSEGEKKGSRGLKGILLISFLIFFLIFVSCGKKDGTEQAESKSKSTGTLKIGLALGTFGLGDRSFNDMQYNGLIEAYRNHNIDVAYRIPADNSYSSYLDIFRELIEYENCSLIIAGEGFQMSEVVESIADDYPDVVFVVMDFTAEYHPNIVSTSFAQNEGAFVVGALSALMTQSGEVGFIGGVDIPVVKEFEAGFVAGVRYINPRIKLHIEYCSLLPDFSGFSNPSKGYRMATEMYNRNVDIIFSVAGGTGNGIISAASATSNFVIGVDSNQDDMAPGFVLTSMMKRLDVAVIDIVSRFIEGSLKGGVYRYDIKNGGISLTDMQFTHDIIPEKILRQIQIIENKIADGTIKVPQLI